MSVPSTSTAPKAPSSRTWWLFGGILGLAFGYFLWYTPYAALTKALSSGLLPGMDSHVGGFVLLPAAAVGTLIGAITFLAATGWWRYIGTREMRGRLVRRPSRTMIVAGFFMALVIATTTLNYTFVGVSILFMLLMMRAGVLILAPIVDTARRRRVRVYSWVALGFSVLAVVSALVDVTSYTLTLAAGLSLAVYYSGYIGRFQIMSKVAKTGDENTDRRYFAEEAITAAIWQVLLCAILAVVGFGWVSDALREGFTSFLFSPAALPAIGVGLLYSALYVYGTLIYLNPREYTWCVPANRCASLLSGLVASLVLTWLAGVAMPGTGQFVALGFVVLAIASLSYPAVRGALASRRRSPSTDPLLLFVCGGNTCRSAMAEAIARSALAAGGWRITSAGLTATPGAAMPGQASVALSGLGVPVNPHRARLLTPDLVDEAHTIYVMTAEQRDAIAASAPHAADKIICLNPVGDIADPHGQAQSTYDDLAGQLRDLITTRLGEATSPRT